MATSVQNSKASLSSERELKKERVAIITVQSTEIIGKKREKKSAEAVSGKKQQLRCEGETLVCYGSRCSASEEQRGLLKEAMDSSILQSRGPGNGTINEFCLFHEITIAPAGGVGSGSVKTMRVDLGCIRIFSPAILTKIW